jgi:hypothetical protein
MKFVIFILLIFSFSLFSNTDSIIQTSIDKILQYTRDKDIIGLLDYHDTKELIEFKKRFDQAFKDNNNPIFKKKLLSLIQINDEQELFSLSYKELSHKIIGLILTTDDSFLLYPQIGNRYIGHTKKDHSYYIILEGDGSYHTKYGETYKVLKCYIKDKKLKIKFSAYQLGNMEKFIQKLKTNKV